MDYLLPVGTALVTPALTHGRGRRKKKVLVSEFQGIEISQRELKPWYTCGLKFINAVTLDGDVWVWFIQLKA